MEKIQTLIQLTRLNKPIGFMLLFWPCLWGLTLGYNFNLDISLYKYYILLFFSGSVLMRSAGCIVNDIVDKSLDRKVKRTKKRPIASGKVSIFESLIYVVSFCFLALFILIQFNLLTIILGFASMILVFSYPLMKRITYWPQLFLGLTFNWGIIMAWTAINNYLAIEPIILYISAIFWTLGYDTIYGLQDIRDDEIIGVKSTSIKFKNNLKFFVGICYILCITCLLILGWFLEANRFYFILLLIPIFQFMYQIKKFEKRDPDSCLKTFKSNNLQGFLIFLNLSILIY